MNFITNLDQHHKMLPLLGGLQLPLDNITTNSIRRFFAPAVGEIQKIHIENMRELGTPWLTN